MQNTKDVNPSCNVGNTPLHFAAKCGRLDLCKLLSQSLLDKSPKNIFAETPLHFAVCGVENLEVVKFLFKNMVDKNPGDCFGKTPINVATEYKRLEILSYLKFKLDQQTTK